MKYYKQKKSYDCSVIALLNALTFLGKEYDYQIQYNYFARFLKLNSSGVLPNTFGNFVKAFFVNIKHKKNPTIKYLRKELKKGNAVILGSDYNGFAHVGLLMKITEKQAHLVNWGSKHPTIRRVKIEKLEEWISQWAVCYSVDRE